jgi:hypothetical protein
VSQREAIALLLAESSERVIKMVEEDEREELLQQKEYHRGRASGLDTAKNELMESASLAFKCGRDKEASLLRDHARKIHGLQREADDEYHAIEVPDSENDRLELAPPSWCPLREDGAVKLELNVI